MLQDERCSNGWLDKGKASLRSRKKKCTNRENNSFEVCAMAASVLPAANAYNDYHVKYHSVSGGSALSQSMKYAEAWLYGSLNARPSIRSTFFSFDSDDAPGVGSDDRTPDSEAPAVAANAAASPGCCCCCQQRSSTSGRKRNACRRCVVSMRNFSSVQAFGTVRGGGYHNGYRNLMRPAEEKPDAGCLDPYDLVRQSRLGGMKSATTGRAKSHSPCKRKHVTPLAAVNRLPSPDTVKADASDDGSSSNRRSILECNINPYDLVRKLPDDGDDGSSLLVSDEDVVEVSRAAKTKPHKKHKATLKQRIKSKLQEGGGSSSLKSAKIRSVGAIIGGGSKTSKADEKGAGDPVEGISIAGQKIRIFNSPAKAATTESIEDWISDPSVDDEPESEEAGLEETPKRPPRRKSLKVAGGLSPLAAVHQDCDRLREQPSAQTAVPAMTVAATGTVTTPATSPPTSTHYSDIKSILKKPSTVYSPSSATGGTSAAHESAGCAPPSVADATGSAAGTNATAVAGSAVVGEVGNGDSSGQDFYSATFNGGGGGAGCRSASAAAASDRKVKKQVQFKGMQEQTVEDESGSGEWSRSTKSGAGASASLRRHADAASVANAEETGCDVENSPATAATAAAASGSATIASTAVVTATAAATTPDRRRYSADQTLTVYDDKSNVDRRSFSADHGRRRRRLNVTSLQLPSQVIVNECLARRRGAGSPSLNSSSVFATASFAPVRASGE